MRVLFVASEVAPVAKVGGLGDVIGSLPKALESLGARVTILVPFYKSFEKVRPRKTGWVLRVPLRGSTAEVEVFESNLPGSKVRILLPRHPLFFRDAIYGEIDDPDRFAFLCAVALKLLQKSKFDLVHCHDWHTGLIPLGLRASRERKESWARIPSLLTVHNVHPGEGIDHLYRHVIPEVGFPNDKIVPTPDAREDSANLLAQGVAYADAINTVSPSYAKEIQTEAFGGVLASLFRKRKNRLFGILNGIDTEFFNPATDRYIRARYTPQTLERKAINNHALETEVGWRQSDGPLFGMVSRITEQKGGDLVAAVGKEMRSRGARVVILGTGDPRHEALVHELQNRFPDTFRVFIKFDAALAQRVYAGSDFFLMPSRFEPCGLGQMIAMRYGTIPIVHKTGGLADTVKEGETGFVFAPFTKHTFGAAIDRALRVYRNPSLWRKMQKTVMAQNFSWDRSARQYFSLYEKLIKEVRAKRRFARAYKEHIISAPNASPA